MHRLTQLLAGRFPGVFVALAPFVTFAAFATFALALVLWPVSAHAGGGPENALLVVDPTNDESLYIANYYRAARGIPESNVLYMAPGAKNYETFVDFNQDGLLGSLNTRDLRDHIDYVVVPPGGSFYIPMPDLVDSRGCTPVRRMATSSAYTLAFSSDDTLAGDRNVMEPNRFHRKVNDPIPFSSTTSYYSGVPSTSASARQYFIGFMLGYSGERGNSIEEIRDMIDRSVGSDGTGPDGTFYFVRTSDIRSTPRHQYYPAVISAIEGLGGQGEEMFEVDGKEVLVPADKHDILGVATGHANPPIDKADMTLLPGTFADHITSFAATFDTGGQTKLSRWIANGASGSMGTVEEPCVFGPGITGKFPDPRLHVWYFQGMSLGESLLRSIQWAPYQGLFVGDPLTRPYASFPQVDVPDAPLGPVSGVVTISPAASSPDTLTGIDAVDMYVDGRRWASGGAGDTMSIDTTVLADGEHDLRVVAYDDTPVRNQGRWLGALIVDNAGRSATIGFEPPSGELDTEFLFDVAADGGEVVELRLVEGTRVLAATDKTAEQFKVRGKTLGGGTAVLRVEAEYKDGRMAISPAASVAVSYTVDAAPVGDPAPMAHDVTIDAVAGEPLVLNLPAISPGGHVTAAEVVSGPTQATVESGANVLLLRPAPNANGTDTMTYRAVSGDVQSDAATATIRYCALPWVIAAPMATEVCSGSTATVRAVVGDGNNSFQWYKDGVAIPGAVGSELVLRNVGQEDVADYHVDVTAHCGRVARRVSTQPAGLSLVTNPDLCGSSVWLPYAMTEHR